MWNIIWKEKCHAWMKTLLGLGKIAINLFAWILAYAIYDKSAVFVEKAKKMVVSEEYMSTDLLAREKIELVYLSGVFLTGIIVIGIAVLFSFIIRSDFKKKRHKTALFMALGYKKRDLYRYYGCNILVDTVISGVVSLLCALGGWQIFLSAAEEYVQMLELAGMDRQMNMMGAVYAIVLAFILQFAGLVLELRKQKKFNLREMLTGK